MSSSKNIFMIEKKKTELYQELGLQARDLRFQHVMSIATRNNRIIMRMEVMVFPVAEFKPSLILAHWFSCTARKQQVSVTCSPAVNVSLELCLYTLVTIFLVEHWRNITNIVTEVKAGMEPLLNPLHSAVSLQLAWDFATFLLEMTFEDRFYQSPNHQMCYSVRRNLQWVFF